MLAAPLAALVAVTLVAITDHATHAVALVPQVPLAVEVGTIGTVVAATLGGLVTGAVRGFYGFAMHRVNQTDDGEFEVEGFDPQKLTRTIIIYAIAGAVIGFGGGDPTVPAIQSTIQATPIIVVAGEALNEFVPYLQQRHASSAGSPTATRE